MSVSGDPGRPARSSHRRHRRHRRRSPLAGLAIILVTLLVVAGGVTGIVVALSGSGKGAGAGGGGGTGTGKPGSSSPASGTSGSATHDTSPPPNPDKSRTFLGPDGLESSWVVAENKLPGSDGWHIRDIPATGTIEGFANHSYVKVGDALRLYVSTTAPSFKVEAFRMGYYGGLGARLVWTSPSRPGTVQPSCGFTSGINMVSCTNWTESLTFRITSDFLPGEYLLKLVGSGNEQSYVLLTVWDPNAQAAYVVMNPIFTEEAWNTFGGYDFYQGLGNCAPTYPVCNRARVVSLDRPFAAGAGSADFMSNVYPLVRWAEEHGLDVTYADSLTISEHPGWLLHQRTLLSLGHDECWSYAEREAAVAAQQHGVNFVFFGASAVLRHVRVQGSPLGGDQEVVDYRDPSEDPLNGKASPMDVTANTWYSPPTDWPESGLVGEMYAGFIEPGDPAVPFVVSDAGSWLYKGTGLHNGSTIPGIISADFDHVAPGWPMPSDLEVLGHSPVPVSEVQTDLGTWGGNTYSDLTYYTDPTSKSGVLDTGNNNWINAMSPCQANQPNCPSVEVQKITGNLFWLFGQGPAGKKIPSVANWKQVSPSGS